MVNAIISTIFVLSIVCCFLAPLIDGPYNGGFAFQKKLSETEKYGLGVFLGTIGGMLAVHILVRFGAI